MTTYPRIATFKTISDFRAHVKQLGIHLECDDAVSSGKDAPLAQPYRRGQVGGAEGAGRGGVGTALDQRHQRHQAGRGEQPASWQRHGRPLTGRSGS